MSSFKSDLYDFVRNIEQGETIKSPLTLKDVGQNPPVQLISYLSKEPLWICPWNYSMKSFKIIYLYVWLML